MPLQTKVIPLNMGLVNRPDKSLVPDGGLTSATDAYYRINDPAIRRVPGRTQFAVAAEGSPVYGVHHLAFDDAGGKVAARTKSTWWLSDDGETGVFSEATLPDALSPVSDHSRAVYFNNQFVLLDGVNGNLVAKSGSSTFRRHGMTAVPTGIAVERDTSTGSYDGTSDVYYWYWYTEYDSENDLESAFDGDSQAASVSSTSTQHITVTRAAIVNDSADQWRIYRSTVTTADSDDDSRPSYSTGERISTVDIEISQFAHRINAGLQTNTPTANTASAWGSPDEAHTEDGTSATGNKDDVGDWHTFGFSSLVSPVVGVRVRIKAKCVIEDENYRLTVRIGKDSSTYSDVKATPFLSETLNNYWLGAPNDLWGLSLSTSEVEASSFRVHLRVQGDTDTPAFNDVYVDVIEVQVWHRGDQPDDAGTPYDTMVVSGTVHHRNSPPPIASVGASFEGALVTNDVSDPSVLRYSYPGEHHYFPSPYYLNIETPDADVITAMASRQDRLIVGLHRAIVRVDYLPSDADFDFNRGRPWQLVSTAYGIVGRAAVTQVQIEGQPQVFAFIDRYQGLCATDGYRCWTLSEGLAWQDMVNPDLVHVCSLINYPKWSALVLYYAAAGSQTVNKRLIYHYHPSHVLQGGRMKVTGPCHLPFGGAAGIMRVGSEVYHLYGDFTGGVWLEDSGVTPNAPTDGFQVETGDIYPAGLAAEANVERVYVHYSDHNLLTPMSMSLWALRSEQGPQEVQKQRRITLDSGLVRFPGASAEAVRVGVALGGPDEDIGLDYLVLAYRVQGMEDS